MSEGRPKCRNKSAMPSKINRSQVEKDRRMRMKILLTSLASLVPSRPSQLAPHDLLEEATNYMKELQEKIKKLKERREELKMTRERQENDNICCLVMTTNSDSTYVEVNFKTKKSFNYIMLNQIIAVLGEEGAQVLAVDFSTLGTTTFYTVKSEALYARIGIETSRLQERLEKLVSS